MDYIQLIEKWTKNIKSQLTVRNRLVYLIQLFQELKNQGFTQKDMDSKIGEKMIDLYTIPDLIPELKTTFNIYLLKIIDKASKLVLTEERVEKEEEKKPEPEKVSTPQAIDSLKPEDFKDKEYDQEFLDMVGLEKPE